MKIVILPKKEIDDLYKKKAKRAIDSFIKAIRKAGVPQVEEGLDLKSRS